jgi:hypothetical protein
MEQHTLRQKLSNGVCRVYLMFGELPKRRTYHAPAAGNSLPGGGFDTRLADPPVSWVSDARTRSKAANTSSIGLNQCLCSLLGCRLAALCWWPRQRGCACLESIQQPLQVALGILLQLAPASAASAAMQPRLRMHRSVLLWQLLRHTCLSAQRKRAGHSTTTSKWQSPRCVRPAGLGNRTCCHTCRTSTAHMCGMQEGFVFCCHSGPSSMPVCLPACRACCSNPASLAHPCYVWTLASVSSASCAWLSEQSVLTLPAG